MTRPCVAVLVIFNAFPCSGITGGVQLEGGALFFNPSPIVAFKYKLFGRLCYLQEVGVTKTIYFSYTITLSTCPIYVDFKPTFLGFSFYIMQLNF